MDLNLQPKDGLKYAGGYEVRPLQVLKMVAALLVVQIHTQSGVKDWLMPLCRIAVPLFFIISGYFTVCADGTLSAGRVKGALVKTLKILLTANAVYFVWSIALSASHGFDFVHYAMTAECWLQWLACGDTFGYHLWYLTAYVQLLAVLYVAVRCGVERVLLWLVPAGLLANVVLGSYHGFYSDEIWANGVSRNFFTIALPCFMLGVFVRRHEHRLPSGRMLAGCGAALLCLMVCERVWLGDERFMDGDVMLSTVPVACVVFCLFLSVPPAFGGTAVWDAMCRWGRNYSLDVYLWHVAANNVVLKFAGAELAGIYTLLALGLTGVIVVCKRRGMMLLNRKRRVTAE